jgi:hypothetical protein
MEVSKPRMNWTKLAIATALAAALITSPTTAYADCGDPDQPPCTGPVPTVDQVTALMNELADPNRPFADKNDAVTPAFTDEQASKLDRELNYVGSNGVLPINFIVTDIEPAPNNFAGATVANNTAGFVVGIRAGSAPVVLVEQGGRWVVTRDTAISRIHKLFIDAIPRVHPVVP